MDYILAITTIAAGTSICGYVAGKWTAIGEINHLRDTVHKTKSKVDALSTRLWHTEAELEQASKNDMPRDKVTGRFVSKANA